MGSIGSSPRKADGIDQVPRTSNNPFQQALGQIIDGLDAIEKVYPDRQLISNQSR